MVDSKIVITLLFCLLFSCSNDKIHPNDSLAEIITFLDEFEEISATVVPHRDIRVVTTNKGHLTFKWVFNYMNVIDKNGVEKSVAQEIVKSMHQLNILSSFYSKDYVLIHSNHSDSSYYELVRSHVVDEKKYNKDYYHREISKKEPYKFVFLKANDLEKVPPIFLNEHRLIPLGDDWYYFRSFYFYDFNEY